MAVEHVLPFVLMTPEWHDGDLRQVWILVLACYRCISAKGARPPAADWMPWLDQRGEHLIASPTPLARDLDQPARPGPRPPASNPGQTPHRGHRDDPALVTARRQNRCQLVQRTVFASAAKLTPSVLPGEPPRVQRIIKILSTERTVVLAPGQACRHPQWREHADPVSTETGLGE